MGIRRLNPIVNVTHMPGGEDQVLKVWKLVLGMIILESIQHMS